MNKIEVAVLDCHNNPGGMMLFLAKLTQRGHKIHNMEDLTKLFEFCTTPGNTHPGTIERIANLPHGTIKRFTPITVAIVGASRRFLAQARTHQVGSNFVSASLQYSDYSGAADFVVPYALIEAEHRGKWIVTEYAKTPTQYYLDSCRQGMIDYRNIAKVTDNDTAGYAAPQGLRNILIMQANHEAWSYFIRTRGCNRNTNETQYVTLRIWEELLKTPDGEEMFANIGPDCMYGACREGKMCCGQPLKKYAKEDCIPRSIIDAQWPLLKEE